MNNRREINITATLDKARPKMTQRDFAFHLGKTEQTIGNWIAGRIVMPQVSYEKALAVFEKIEIKIYYFE